MGLMARHLVVGTLLATPGVVSNRINIAIEQAFRRALSRTGRVCDQPQAHRKDQRRR